MALTLHSLRTEMLEQLELDRVAIHDIQQRQIGAALEVKPAPDDPITAEIKRRQKARRDEAAKKASEALGRVADNYFSAIAPGESGNICARVSSSLGDAEELLSPFAYHGHGMSMKETVKKDEAREIRHAIQRIVTVAMEPEPPKTA